jgi:DnaD/phage-associated family protein
MGPARRCPRPKGTCALDYKLNFSAAAGVFAMPCDAVDKYIKEASCDELKVLLYIFRRGSAGVSTQDICSQLGMAPEQADAAVRFWAGMGLYAVSAAAPGQGSPEAEAAAVSERALEPEHEYSQAEVSSKLDGSEELRFLIDAYSRLSGKPLSPRECSTLIYLNEGAGLPADVILMLAEYCISSGHTGTRYIERTALNWADDGVTTHELAEARIRALEARSSYEGTVQAALGISGRPLTQAERQRIGHWAEWGISSELVKLAYEICADRTGKMSMPYINSILDSWHRKGIKTADEAKAESSGARGRSAKSGTTYDIDKYSRLSMDRLLKDDH